MDVLDDESTFIKLDSYEQEFMTVWSEAPIISSWTNHPKKYKFTGLELLYDNDVNLVARETYGFLEFLGDLGGLNEALRVAFGFILSPLTTFVLSAELMMSLFRVQNRSKSEVKSLNFTEMFKEKMTG